MGMGPRLIRRRRDGLVEIRRARARDVVLSSDTAVLFAMLAGWLVFVGVLVFALVFDPPFLALASGGLLFFLLEQRHNRPASLVPLQATPPRGSAA